MRVQLTTILLLAAPVGARAEGPAAPPAAPVPVVGDAHPVPAPIVPPVAIEPADDRAAARAPEPVTAAPAPAPAQLPVSAPAASLAPRAPPIVPTQALVERVGQADRLFLAGDYRNALFAYQDVVYTEPRYAPARVKLGRAYLALRYPAQALAQAEAALAIDPESADARRLVEEARTPPARPSALASAPAPAQTRPSAVATVSPPAAPPAIPDPPPPAGTRRIYRLTPEPESRSTPTTHARSEVPAPAAELVPASAPATTATAAPGSGVATAVTAATPGAAPAAPSGSAAQHYRAALVLLQNREWARAIAELSTALLADPTLAVAYAARGSAHFGLGKYREAADDYRGALVIDPRMATPVYGLAECYRALGDGRNAVEMYQRYAQSSAPDARDDLRAIAVRRAQELR
jgi:Tfp pilus assembly protein PilF